MVLSHNAVGYSSAYFIYLCNCFLILLYLGNKPNFHLSMGADEAKEMYNKFLRAMKKGYREDRIKDGRFGEYMQVLTP